MKRYLSLATILLLWTTAAAVAPSAGELIAAAKQAVAKPHSFLLSDWREADPTLLPYKTIDRAGHNSKFDQILATTHMELLPSIPDSRFASPPAVASDALWPIGKTSISMPFRLINNHIYVLASINRKRTVPRALRASPTETRSWPSMKELPRRLSFTICANDSKRPQAHISRQPSSAERTGAS